jgi:glycosyltransferase involved in cell wall biosynthesis
VRRIAIFQYEWPLQIHTTNLATALASEGYHVDLFIKGCRTDLVDLSRFKEQPQVRVVNWGNTAEGSSHRSFQQRLFGIYARLVKSFSYTPIMLPAVFSAFNYVRNEKYNYFIGVEKMGMIWAGFLSQLTRTPFVYYSLELYDEEHPDYIGRPGFSALRHLEKIQHRKAEATIIQDKHRGAHLLRSNGMIDHNMIFLPVSVPGPPDLRDVDSYRQKWGIPPELPIVLYLGIFEESRHCLDVASAARPYADRFRVVFHGYGNAKLIEKIRNAGGAALTLSTELVPDNILPDMVASADIGLSLYRNDCANNLLTAFSSEKVALYCRAGIPFIAFDTTSYRELADSFKCCVLIKDIHELPRAVDTIMKDYEVYRSNALQAFQKFYQFETNVKQVIKQLDDMCKN